MASTLPSIERIAQNFELLDDWDDRYRYIIELGQKLPPLGADAKVEENRVHGCVSQVWLVCRQCPARPACLNFEADSDAHIVRGLIAIILALFDGKSIDEIVALDPAPLFERLGLATHLTPSRANGFASMTQRIKALAFAEKQARDQAAT
jgi:cysteine desulfuration protein SufE